MAYDQLITLAEECSDVIHCSYAKGLRLMRAGELPGRKLGATYVIPRAALYKALGLQVPGEKEAEENE